MPHNPQHRPTPTTDIDAWLEGRRGGARETPTPPPSDIDAWLQGRRGGQETSSGAPTPVPERPAATPIAASRPAGPSVSTAGLPPEPGPGTAPPGPGFLGKPSPTRERIEDLFTPAERGSVLGRFPAVETALDVGELAFLPLQALTALTRQTRGASTLPVPALEFTPFAPGEVDPELDLFNRLIQMEEAQPLLSQILGGAVTDPTALIPGLGFLPGISRGARGAGAAARGAEAVRAADALRPGVRATGPIPGLREPVSRTIAGEQRIRGIQPPGSRPGLPPAVRGPAPSAVRSRITRADEVSDLTQRISNFVAAQPERRFLFHAGPELEGNVIESGFVTSDLQTALDFAESQARGRPSEDFIHVVDASKAQLGPSHADVPTDFELLNPAPVEVSFDIFSEDLGVGARQAGPTAEAASPSRLTPDQELERVSQAPVGQQGGAAQPAEQASETFQRVPFRAREAAESPLAQVPEILEEDLIGGLPRPDSPAIRIPPDAPPITVTDSEFPQASGRRFVGDLRSDLAEIAGEVATSENPIVRGLLGRSGVNPAIRQSTMAGRLVTAYARQRVAAEELTKTALAASLDTHAQAVTGRLPLRISPEGLWADTGVPWNDVFSRPQNYNLRPPERAYVDDFLQVVREAEDYRVENGLKPLGMTKEGWFYVPRQTKTVRGIEIQRPSSAKLQRHYDEAADGFAKGVRYDDDPRATLEMHLRTTYKEVIDQQLSDNTLLRSITPKELLQGINPGVIERYDNAVRAGVQAGNRLRQLQRQMRGLQIGGRETGEAGRAAQTLREARRPERLALQRQITAAKAELDQLRNIRNAAKVQYSRAMEAARKREVAPGRLFGAYQPDEISVAQWRNRFYPREEAEQLREGIERLTENRRLNIVFRGLETTGDFTRFLGSVGDLAMPFFQGQPLLAENPRAWGRMLLRHEQAFFNPRVQAKLIQDHLPTYQKMARYGVPIGDPEFFRAIEEGRGFAFGKPLEWIPANTDIGQFARKVRRIGQATGRQTVGRFQASYNTGLGYGRALLWEAKEPTWTGTEAELAQYIRNSSGGLDSRALGVGPNQRAVESFWLAFSPRLLRSTVGLVADAFQPQTPQGRAAIKTLGKWLTGTTTIYVVSGMALGKTWEEIGTGLNPLSGKRFYSHEINGQWYGLGGQIRALLQLIAGVTSSLAPGGRPIESLYQVRAPRRPYGQQTGVNWYENPFIQFYASRGAPGVTVGGGIAEAVTGADLLPYEKVDTLPDLGKHLGTSAYPFAYQAWEESGETLEERSGVAPLVEFGAGLRTSPVTEADVFESQLRQQGAPRDGLGQFLFGLTDIPGADSSVERRQDRIAQELYGMNYLDLPAGKRETVRNREENRRTREQRARESFTERQISKGSERREEERQRRFQR